MAEEKVDMEYLSLYGCIMNTPSDTEMHAEHMRTGVPDQRKRIYRPTQNLVGGRN